MTFRRAWGDRRRWQRAMQIAPLLAMLFVSGCAQMHKLKSRTGEQSPYPSTKITPATASQEAHSGADSLATIVNDKLQHGDYAEGETALRRYLVQHPGDRPAQAILRQLTADPKQRLGRRSRAYVVRPGDSYSTLAARYLGDASLFLILARYNDSTNPSLLRVGQTVRLPLSAADVSTPSTATSPDEDGSDRRAATATSGDATPTILQDTTPAEAPEAAATRLQKESVVLLEQGNKKQALARLDQALLIRPQLKPSGPKAISLRKDLVAAFHQRAIVLYRDQHLDQAIALWNRVLIIDPNYEPALIYRARALELKRRLKQL